ncbi:M50 family metallopeptidase [Gulosibacter sp. 10]|uniref:M50 family metallopeptidase n=1 Tax=Gulosibacter sp. 10 TaxID=1255570 RepID=UPI00097F4EF3|nr:M50 family metallopeptidase [Gulosibacter sp. 10]SJM52746.1 putative integral membrane protein [Gulosibacter sp. 10]
MNASETPWYEHLWERVAPAGEPVELPQAAVLVVLAVAAAVVLVPVLWLRLRLVVTLVHELGHAMIGLLAGRRFNGFVLNGDMSGHAVTTGPTRGFGRVATTWAGYPAPAVVGAVLVWLSVRGWAAPALTIALVLLLVSFVRVRSWLTALIMIIALGATGALWWFRDDELQAPILLAVGIVLVVGAWRHLAAVFAGGGPSSDPGVLAQLTRVPVWLWNASFALVCAGATLVVVLVLRELLPG